jgi:hypothetical protein
MNKSALAHINIKKGSCLTEKKVDIIVFRVHYLGKPTKKNMQSFVFMPRYITFAFVMNNMFYYYDAFYYSKTDQGTL